ncbi:MAG: chorismate-binding protein, partial [Cytophagaceae bacterium]
KEEASDFINKNEKIDRQYFSGYLGPVNLEDETHLFVNLRCARILPQKTVLFAGAGITKDSNPEKEWLETELKFKTIQDFL